ncbi:MAG: XrtA/PEP-CTERM system TPR-repeat protein PrsT [Burkholderiales bacterium]
MLRGSLAFTAIPFLAIRGWLSLQSLRSYNSSWDAMAYSLPAIVTPSLRCLTAVTFSVVLAGGALVAGCDKASAPSIAFARESLEKRDYRTAMAQAKLLLQGASDLPEARYVLGRALVELGDPAGAEVELTRARDLGFSPDAVEPMLLRALIGRNRFREVLDTKALEKVKSPAARSEVMTLVSLANFSLGRRKEAKEIVQAAIQASATNSEAQLLLARLVALEGDSAAALNLIESVAKAGAATSDALKLKGDILGSLNRLDAAAEAYKDAIKVRQDFAAAHASLVWTRLVQSGFDAKHASFQMAQSDLAEMRKHAGRHPQTTALTAQLAAVSGDYKAARESAQLLLSRAPDSPVALQLAGSIEFNLRSYIQAEALLLKALQIDPEASGSRRWLAMTYVAQGQTDKAVRVIEPALVKGDASPELLALAGESHMQAGNYKRAEELLLLATKARPDDVASRTVLALARMGLGETERAFADLERISQSDRGSVADMALIANAMRLNQFDRALKALASLERKTPDNPTLHYLRGKVLLSKADRSGARKSLERALEVAKGFYPAAASLATLDVEDKNPAAAQKRFESVLAENPRNALALLALAEVRREASAPREEILGLLNKAIEAGPGDVAPRVGLVNFHLGARDFKSAVVAAQSAVAALPDRGEAYEILAIAYAAAGDNNQALATYGQMARLQPNSPQPHLRVAELYAMMKNPEASAQSLRKALAIQPNLVTAQRGLALLDLKAGRATEATRLAKELQKQRPREAIGYLLEGDILMSSKKFAEAAEAYSAGMKASISTELVIKRHGALHKAGKASEAEQILARWVNDYPEDKAARLYAAEAAAARKDFAAAFSGFKAVLQVAPDDPRLLNNLAFVAARLKSPEARDFAERAHNLLPKQPEFMDTLAMILADAGENERALELLFKASRAAPKGYDIQLNYARVLIKAGRTADAKRELGILQLLGEQFPAHAEVTKLLRSL